MIVAFQRSIGYQVRPALGSRFGRKIKQDKYRLCEASGIAYITRKVEQVWNQYRLLCDTVFVHSTLFDNSTYFKMKASFVTAVAVFFAAVDASLVFYLSTEPNGQGIRKSFITDRWVCHNLADDGLDNQASWAYVDTYASTTDAKLGP